MRRICVFCGSSPGFDPACGAMARRLGAALVEGSHDLVYGGARVGLMGEVADAVLGVGGVVHGVIPEAIVDRVGHGGLTQLHVVGSMHERKTRMFDLSDAFIALPGGMGTLEEIAELLTWAQLGLHAKPCGLINVNGYYDLLLSFLDHTVQQGFMKQEHRAMLLVASDAVQLLDAMRRYMAPTVGKWVDIGNGS